MDSLWISFDKISANDIDFVVGSDCYLINEVSDGKFCALRQNVLNVFWFNEFALFDCLENASFVFTSLEFLVFLVFLGLLEKEDSVRLDQKVDEFSLFFEEKVTILIFEHDHLLNLLLVIFNSIFPSSPVNNKQNTLLDVFKGLKSLVQVSDELG